MNTAPLARVSATPPAPNKMVSVCAALTTTLTTISASLAACAGVFAPLPPSATKRATLSAETSQPVTSNPARRSEVAMPKPIEPSPITAMRGFADSDIDDFSPMPHSRHGLTSGYHGLAPLPKRETTQAYKERCMSDAKIREAICRFGRSLFERGLTPGSSGNISVRCDDGGWLVTPTNASLGSLEPARLSRLGADNRLVEGDPPTKEIPLHAALDETRSASRAIVHLHSTHSVALSMLPEIDPRAALPAMTPYYLMRCGATALLPYYRPGDPAVADAITGLAGKYSSVLLANHGPVVSGDTLEAAVFAMEELEETAKLYLLLRGLNPRYLSPEQVTDLTKVFGLTMPEHGHD